MSNLNPPKDQDVQEVMQGLRARPHVAADVEQRVYEAALAAFEALPQEHPASATRSMATSVTGRFAIAASVAVLAVGGLLVLNSTTEQQPPSVGRIAYASGAYTLSQDKAEAGQLLAGTTVATTDRSRVLIELNDSTTLRLDHNTRATLTSNEQVFIESGRAYVDSQGSTHALVLQTPTATITKVGTQFEVSSTPEGLRVAVREGQIKVTTQNATVPARADQGVGEELSFDPQSRFISSNAITSFDQTRWQWTQASRPLFDHTKGSLFDYLHWVARESGRDIVFTNPSVENWAKRDSVHRSSDIEDLEDVMRASEKQLQIKSSPPHQLLIGRNL